MTTEIEISFPGKIQNKFQFCARINTFITAVLPHSSVESSALLSYSQEGFCIIITIQLQGQVVLQVLYTLCLCLENSVFIVTTSSYVFSPN